MLLYFVILSVIPFLHGTIINEYKSYKDYKVYEVEGNNEKLRNMMKTLAGFVDLPVYTIIDSKVELLIDPEIEEMFKLIVKVYNLKLKVVVDDYSEIINSGVSNTRLRGREFDWKDYYDVDILYDYLRKMSKSYSNWTQLVVGGESYEGRQLLGLRINTPTKVRGPKKTVFIESGIHAREWITPAATTYFINKLLTSNDPKLTELRDKFDWHIFPTINPDGYHFSHTTDRMWRKTRSTPNALFVSCVGADPNRNWDYNWMQSGATNNPCDYQLYAGSRPFSEKETRTLSKYLAGLKNLLAYIAVHSDVQMLLVPYSDSTAHFDNYDDLVKIGKTSIEYGYKVNGARYRGPGTAVEMGLGKASGSSMDWVRNKLGVPLAFAYELRGFRFDWPKDRIHEQGEEFTQMILGLFTEAANLGYC